MDINYNNLATTKICDGCGVISQFTVNTQPTYDFCYTCVKSYDKWLIKLRKANS